MPRKKKKELTFYERLLKIKHSGIEGSKPISAMQTDVSNIETLAERLQKILGLTKNEERNPTDMLFFVMYDIENDKVRHQVAKYLLAKGCTRIQNSVFLADLATEVYEQIRKDLTEVQACYDNKDSILIVPLSTDHIKAMRVIGKTVDTEIVMHNKNTIFF